VKGAFAFDGIVGAYASPYTPGTAYVLLHHCFGEVNGKSGVWGHALGGMGAISQAMARAAEARGARIRTNAGVAGLIVEGGRATGVRLQSGESIKARVVAANVAPKLLFRDLVPQGAVERDLHSRFTSIKSGSGTFRMNVALSELPDFVCRPGKQQQDRVVPSADGRLSITTIKYPLHRVCGKKPGEDRELPSWDSRHAGRQVGHHVAAVQQITEERAKRCDHQGGPPGAKLMSVAAHKIRHVNGTNCGQVENLARKSLG